LFEEAIRGPGQESIAASARLAELYLKGPSAAKRAGVPELLAATVKDVANAKEFKNQLIQVEELRNIFEQAVETLVRDGAHEQALTVADTYAVLSETSHNRELRAKVLSAWAQALEKARGDFKPKARDAAAEYEALAGYQPAATAKADSLKQAATLYRHTGEPEDAAKAVEVLQTALRLPQLSDTTAAALWYDLADALIAAKRPDEVWPAFNQIMKLSTPISTAARYKLARQFIDTRNAGFVALGRELFVQIARQENPPEQEFHERALVELAHEFIRSNNFADAETWLRKQLNIYPTGPESSLGRLLLGVCLLQRASGPPLPGLDAKSALLYANEKRTEALKLFQQIVRDVDKKRDQTTKLSDRDNWLRLQAGLRVLQTYQQLQQPEKLLGEAGVLMERHRGTIEELIIRSLVYHAFKQQGKTVEMLQTRDQMKDLFERLPPSAFLPLRKGASPGEYNREYWEEVWFKDK
jgi:tetratricopeptide (TPR) repeat protein